MLKRLFLALALVGGLCAPALAQVQNDLSGNETWNVGQGPGGPGGDITSAMVRGSTNVAFVAISGATVIGGTAGSAPVVEGGNLMMTSVTTANITMPANPVTNGAIIGFCNATAAPFATTQTVVANAGQSLVGAATLVNIPASSCIYWTFRRSNTTWYRIT